MTTKSHEAAAFARGESETVMVIFAGALVSTEKTIGPNGPVFRTRYGVVLKGAKECLST